MNNSEFEKTKENSRLRILPRFDYKKLHETGTYCEKYLTFRSIDQSADSESSNSQSNSPPLFLTPIATCADLDKTVVPEISDVAECFSQFHLEMSEANEKNKMSSETDYGEHLSILEEELHDFLDENNINFSVVTVEDLDSYVNRLEIFRKDYRVIDRNIKKSIDTEQYEIDYERRIKNNISTMKDCIMLAKDKRRKTREEEVNAEFGEKSEKERDRKETFLQKQDATQFLVEEVLRIIGELKDEFSKTKTDVSDEELLRRKEEYPENSLQLEWLSNKIRDVYQILPEGFNVSVINSMKDQYASLLREKKLYDTNLQQEIKSRELLKEKTFQTSSLNIKLPKFKGYQSEMDIYSFQIEFEKLYLRVTPKKLLPDLLKNNYLSEPALSMVKNQDNIDDIWNRLKKAYGDKKIMLQKKLSEVLNIGSLKRIKDSEQLKEALIKIINSMIDLMKLAEKHDIENKLYSGDALNMIYELLGDARLTRWFHSIIDQELEDKALWMGVIQFLEKELRVLQEKSLIGSLNNMSQDKIVKPKEYKEKRSFVANHENSPHIKKCHFCDEYGHTETNGPKGSNLIQYFSCEKFVKMGPYERFKELRSRGLCHQCLFPGAKLNDSRHSNGACQKDYVCKNPSHDRYNCKKHVLVCSEHCDTEENKALFEEYKSRFILKQKRPLPEFSKEIKLSFHAYWSDVNKNKPESIKVDNETINDDAIYTLQIIEVDGERFTLFFDTGCSDLVSKYDAIKRIKNNAQLEVKGPMTVGGVGDIKVDSTHGIYQVTLPLYNGRSAVMSGICLDDITGKLPMYPLNTQVKDDIEKAYKKAGGDVSSLPKLPSFVGGKVDFMIGSKYLRYYPETVFSLPSGLTIYRSPFVNADGGGRGVVGGPHKIFTKISQKMNNYNCLSYLTDQYKLFKIGYQVNPDASLLNVKFDKDVYYNLVTCESSNHGSFSKEKHCPKADSLCQNCFSCTLPHFVSVRSQKHFEEAENAASQLLFRCIECRTCQKCKNADQTETMSIKEEIEQDLINKSVTVDIEAGQTIAKLPLLENPVTKLAPSKHKALAVYYNQVRKLDKCKKDRDDVIEAEGKLQSLGFVEYVHNLTLEQQKKLKENPVQNFIPWFPVWNLNSLSFTCRPVFNGSMTTDTSVSLNSILPKGKNNMNRLVEIMIRWGMHLVGVHTDIRKMYNSIKLVEEHWCLQRYIWQENLDPSLIPAEKIIKTLIYGIRSSGNQAERGLRVTADKFKESYPEVHRIVRHDVYVDDCMTGEGSIEAAHQRADELSLVLRRGGFNLKGFTFSGKPPNKDLSPDGKYINVAGLKWYPETDELQLDISELNFSKKRRGRKNVSESSHIVPADLNRRQCVGKVAEIFDLKGMMTPITASLKVDLHVLVQRKLNWEDRIPDELRPIWLSNFDLINEIKNVRFKRAIIPSDAVDLNINTIDFGDSSKNIACIAIYARFHRKNHKYSSQLVFARSKLIPEGMTQPRAELFAAHLNAHTGEVVRRSFSNYHKYAHKLTDSQITLHWINNTELPLKQWVRNRVVDICRFTNTKQWKYVQSNDMVADIGTRRCSSINDVAPGSVWREGFPWMTEDDSSFPVKSVDEIKLSNNEVLTAKNEMVTLKQGVEEYEWPYFKSESFEAFTQRKCVVSDVGLRYQFSQYIIDPNRYQFKKVVRIVGLLKLFIRKFVEKHLKKTKIESSVNKKIHKNNDISYSTDQNVVLANSDIKEAENYFYKKATLEVKKFAKDYHYKDISIEKEDILYYTGRILPEEQINDVSPMTNVMKDLCSTTFFVPIIEKYSPLAYSIINEVHWNDPVAKHAGVETVLRYTLKYGYIIEGRDLVKRIKKRCEKCRFLRKRTIDVIMGPISKFNITIAPPFYITQVDIAGPYKAFTPHNKRVTIKVYFVAFCCATTATINIKVMDSYSTESFVQSFIRMSCEVGYPKMLLIDEGSQLKKACQIMKLSFVDIKHNLYVNHSVEFDVCPVGGHNFHGKVERKIKQVKESLEKVLNNERLSILEWETVGAEISNCINDLPIALRNWSTDLENIDLITPNRLRLGRNNDRSPIGPLIVTSNSEKFIKSNQMIFNTWFENWLISCVPKLMIRPKWFKTDFDMKEGDVVLFLKQEGKVIGNYQYGIVDCIERGRDGKIRIANIKYYNNNESCSRTTRRAVRELVMIHHVDELNIYDELGEAATYGDMMHKLKHTVVKNN